MVSVATLISRLYGGKKYESLLSWSALICCQSQSHKVIQLLQTEHVNDHLNLICVQYYIIHSAHDIVRRRLKPFGRVCPQAPDRLQPTFPIARGDCLWTDMTPPVSVPCPKVIKKPKSTVSSIRAGGEAPPPPPGVEYPANTKHKRCKRCGVWSTSPCQYNQQESPEAAWGPVIAWEQGCLTHPSGNHCLLCRKAGFLLGT